MDEEQIYIQVQKCKHLKYKFRDVYAADNYPLNLPVNSFIIVNASRADSIAKRYANPVLYFADPLALPLTTYKDIFVRLHQCTDLHMMMDVKEQQKRYSIPLQSADSQLCGLFCIYIAHYFYSSNSSKFPFVPDVNELQLLVFVKHME